MAISAACVMSRLACRTRSDSVRCVWPAEYGALADVANLIFLGDFDANQLHEANILEVLRCRSGADDIYT